MSNNKKDEELWLDRKDNRNKNEKRNFFGVKHTRFASKKEESRERALKDWYGESRGRLEIMAHQRQSESIGDILPKVFKKFKIESGTTLEQMQKSWVEVVGKDIAKISKPYGLKNGLLEIEIYNSVWMFELERMHKSAILAKVKSASKGKINNIRFIPPGRQYSDKRVYGSQIKK